MKRDVLKSCVECSHSRWLVGVGQGYRCVCPGNAYKKLSEHATAEREHPVIPSRKFVCENWEVRDESEILDRMIFRHHDRLLDGYEIDEEELLNLKEMRGKHVGEEE